MNKPENKKSIHTEINSHNYTYSQVVNEHVPAIIGGVLNYTNKTRLQYVGHSNGGRSMLDTLTTYSNTGMSDSGKYCTLATCNQSSTGWADSSFGTNPVETYVGVGVPGAFEELSYFAQKINESGKQAITSLNDKVISHVTSDDISWELGFTGKLLTILPSDDYTISLNLFSQYYNWINSSEDLQPGKDLALDNFAIIQGTDGLGFSRTNDGIISIKDEDAIYHNIISANKFHFTTSTEHRGMSESTIIKYVSKKIVDKEKFPISDSSLCYFLISTTNSSKGCI